MMPNHPSIPLRPHSYASFTTESQNVAVAVSVLTLTFISIDRWYAICFPLRYVSTNVRAIGSIAFIWGIALITGMLVYFDCSASL